MTIIPKRIDLSVWLGALFFHSTVTAGDAEWGMIRIRPDYIDCMYKFPRMDLSIETIEHIMQKPAWEQWSWGKKVNENDSFIKWVPWATDHKERTFKEVTMASGGIAPATYFGTRQKLERFYEGLNNIKPFTSQEEKTLPPHETRLMIANNMWSNEPCVIDELDNYYSLVSFKKNAPLVAKVLAQKQALLQQQEQALLEQQKQKSYGNTVTIAGFVGVPTVCLIYLCIPQKKDEKKKVKSKKKSKKKKATKQHKKKR